MKASVNYVGKSSMVIGIRVEAENIQSGVVKHCNSSYFTMVSKDKEGNNARVPGLLLSNANDVRRFQNCLKHLALKKEINTQNSTTNFDSIETILGSNRYNVKLDLV
jgi:acyl-CoA hydrolase